ncbi:MAG: VanZ family protein [Deltaproteobacteria bacterium]|nr:VanZ family protein [Deltaproteobacteria bacterium]
MALIWILSSISLQIPVVASLPFKDKGIHFIEYAVLGALNTFALTRTFPASRKIYVLLLAIFLTVTWGVLDEIHQAFVPGRTSASDDVLADSLGAVCGALLFLLVLNPKIRKRKPSAV